MSAPQPAQQRPATKPAVVNGKPAAPGTQAPPAPASRLGKVQRGRLKVPYRYVFYGPEGVGKSTLAAHSPAPIWFDIEDGSADLDVARYPFRLLPNGDVAPGGYVPQSYPDVLAAIDDLTNNVHTHKTLVIDTADRLESLLWRWMLERDSKSGPMNKSGRVLHSIEEYGYGKGFQLALDEWRALCLRLDRLRLSRGMEIIVLAHMQIKNFKNPTGEDYDRYQLRLNPLAAGYLREWSDAAGFFCFDEGGNKLDKDDDRAKGYSTGRRLLKMTRTAAHDAKTRLALPEEIEVDISNPWGPFAAAVAASYEVNPAELARLIDAEVERIGGVNAAVAAQISAAREKADVGALSRYLMELKKRPDAVVAPETNPNEKGA